MEDNQHTRDWVAALRSGEYTQATGAMRVQGGLIGDSFCCLGVACHLAGEEFGNDGLGLRTAGVRHTPYDKFQSQYLPTWLEEMLGVLFVDQEELTRLNDGGFNFLVIANIIEYSASHSVSIVDARWAVSQPGH